MNMEFIGDGPALVIEDELRLLIVADLHFGIEADLAAHGLHFKSRSADRLDHLLKTIDKADPDQLIILVTSNIVSHPLHVRSFMSYHKF